MFNNFRAVATSHETVSRTKPYSAQRPTTPPHDDNDSCYRLEPSHSNKHSTFVRNSSHNSRFSNSTLELQAPTQTFPAHASTFAESHCYSASSDQSLIDEFSCNNTRRSGLAVQFSPNSAITSVNYTACNFGRQPPPCIVPLNATPEIHPALTAQVIIDQKPAVVTSAPNDISNSTTKAENHTISPQLRQHSAFSLLSRKLDNPAGYKKQWKAWMYHVLHPSKHQTALTGFSKFLHYFFIVNTVVSIALLIASTDPILASNFKAEVVMFTFDSVVTTVFLIEFLMHVSIAKSWWAFWNVSRVLDLLNIVPFFVELVCNLIYEGSSVSSVLSATYTINPYYLIRILRLMRVAKVGRILHSSEKLKLLLIALKRTAGGILVLLITLWLNIVFLSTCLYYAEQTQETFYNGAWHYTDGHLSGFQSISDCFWIVIQTLSTVGYGDTVPQTPLGRFVLCIAMVMSLFVIAFPMTMISIKYSQVVSKYIQQKRILRNKLKEAAARDPDHQKINGGDFMKQYRKLDEDEDDEDLDETTEDEFSAVYHSAKSGGSSSLFDDGHGTEHHHRHQSQQHKKTPSESKGFPSSAIIQISGMDGSDIGDNNVATMTVKVRSREHYMKLLTMLASSA